MRRELVDAAGWPDASVTEGPAVAVASAEAAEISEASEALIAQRCADTRPHGPHPVPPRGTWTGFTCPGPLAEAELERLLNEAFA